MHLCQTCVGNLRFIIVLIKWMFQIVVTYQIITLMFFFHAQAQNNLFKFLQNYSSLILKEKEKFSPPQIYSKMAFSSPC